MNNPIPFIVILDDPSIEDPDQMSKVIAARLQNDARLVLASPILRTEEVPARAITARTGRQ
jgi:hypothetical protein